MVDVVECKKMVEEITESVTPDNVRLFDEKEDQLELNYTVNCFFDNDDLGKVKELLDSLKSVDGRQLIYQSEMLHVTLLGQISIKTKVGAIKNVVNNFLRSNQIAFHLWGVGSSQKVMSVTAFPEGFEIVGLRSQLRDLGGGTEFTGPYESLAWINILRYLQKPKPELLSKLKEYYNTDFGVVKPKRIALLKNASRTLKGAEVVHEFI